MSSTLFRAPIVALFAAAAAATATVTAPSLHAAAFAESPHLDAVAVNDDVADDIPGDAVPARASDKTLPNARQLALQELELGALVEYGISTVAGVDRRSTPSPLVFHPDDLDARTWVSAASAAGARFVVLTVREPSGFCLWPSAASNYHVGVTPWRDGKGDLVRDVVDACRAQGLAVGFRLSAADTGLGVAATPGKPGARSAFGDRVAHREKLLAQLRELCTNYGELCLVWIEEEYDPFGWDTIDAETREPIGSGPGEELAALVHQLQPGAVLLGTPFPEARRLAGERGFAPDPLILSLTPGHDPRLRPDFAGWLAPIAVGRARDSKRRLFGARDLVESWQRSVGAGATLVFELDIDGEGHVPPAVRTTLEDFGAALAWRHAPHAARDLVLAWGESRHPSLDLGQPIAVDRVVLGEDLFLGGQRVFAHVVEVEVDGRWEIVSRGTTIGRQRVHAFAPVVTQRIRLRITDATHEPVLSRMDAYNSLRTR